MAPGINTPGAFLLILLTCRVLSLTGSQCVILGAVMYFATVLLLMLVLLPLQVLSGGMTPRESMPEIIQSLMLAAPNTHFVILAQSILFRGAGLDVIWPQFAALLGIGSVLFYFSLRRFRSFLR